MTLDETLRLPGPGDFLPPEPKGTLAAWQRASWLDAHKEALAISARCSAFVQRFGDAGGGIDDVICAMERAVDEIRDALAEAEKTEGDDDWRSDQDADLRIRERLQECG